MERREILSDLHEFLFDVPATTTVRVRAASREDALAEIGEMQCLNWDLVHNQTMITELSLLTFPQDRGGIGPRGEPQWSI
jgi:hypothetical protein